MAIVNMLIEFVFSIALLVNAALFLPQIVRLYKVKDSKELSLLTFGGFLAIQTITVLHGLVVNDYLLVFGFSLSILTCGLTTWLIVWYRIMNP
jgi:MtN3 and saliva related transmembrane protein